MLPVEYGIGELCYPVAEHEQSCALVEGEVYLHMTVAVKEEVDVGMCLQVVLGILHEVLLLFSEEWCLVSVNAFLAAMFCPSVAQP